jgi:hypothetical protein
LFIGLFCDIKIRFNDFKGRYGVKSDQKKQSRSLSARRKRLRDSLWPDITEDRLWLRTQRTGFTTIPRAMGLIGRIMDQLSGKGTPLIGTYLTLWCWVFDEGFVEVRNPKEFAYESGFSGPRSEGTWRSRMRKLEELGFIMTKPGVAGEFQYVLIMNPIHTIEMHYKKLKKDHAYDALISRLVQIGADDLDDLPII